MIGRQPGGSRQSGCASKQGDRKKMAAHAGEIISLK